MADVPDFLLDNVDGRLVDQKRLLIDLQKYCLWREVNGDKPYNAEKADMLQKDLAADRDAHLLKVFKKATLERIGYEKSVQYFAHLIASRALEVEVFCESGEISVPNGKILWNQKIRDKLTGEVLGTPRQMFADDKVNFVDCDDPLRDLETFIANLKEYDGFERSFRFERTEMAKRARFFRLTLVLKWAAFSEKELIKRAKKWVMKG